MNALKQSASQLSCFLRIDYLRKSCQPVSERIRYDLLGAM